MASALCIGLKLYHYTYSYFVKIHYSRKIVLFSKNKKNALDLFKHVIVHDLYAKSNLTYDIYLLDYDF